MSKYLDVALKAAKASGIILKKHFNTGVKPIHKGVAQYVTEVDYKSQDIIKGLLKKYFPGHNIVSEEAKYDDQGSDYTWYIDPLDGTHNYMRNVPIFGVTIALVKGSYVKVGVSHFPLIGKTYYAEQGKGAFMNGKRIHVSMLKPEQHYAMFMELKSASRARVLKLFKAVETEKNSLRAFACSSYETSLLAEGNIDAFVPLGANFYDVAAGVLLVEEAGGRVTDTHGRRWSPNTDDFIFSNGLLHNKMLSFIKKAGL